MRPAIAIPYSPAYKHNASGTQPCLLCGKAVNLDKAKWVKLDEGLGLIVDPETPEPNGGHFPIGPDCWRKNPALKEYLAS